MRAKLTCVDTKALAQEFVGREFNEQLLSDLPPEVDPCGENGEFHTFTYAGPMFRDSLSVQVGEIVSAATPAIGIAVDMNGLKMSGPHIRGNKAAVKGFVIADKELHSFGNLQRCDKIHDRPHHTYGVASVFHSRDGISPI